MYIRKMYAFFLFFYTIFIERNEDLYLKIQSSPIKINLKKLHCSNFFVQMSIQRPNCTCNVPCVHIMSKMSVCCPFSCLQTLRCPPAINVRAPSRWAATGGVSSFSALATTGLCIRHASPPPSLVYYYDPKLGPVLLPCILLWPEARTSPPPLYIIMTRS